MAEEKYEKIKEFLKKTAETAPESHNQYRDHKLSLPMKKVTETVEINGKTFTGTFRVDEKREARKEFQEREKALAVVLSHYGFDVAIINDDKNDEKAMAILGAPSPDRHKNPDASLNQVIVDLKMVDGKSPNAPGRNYHDGIKKDPSQGVVLYLPNFSKLDTKKSVMRKSRGGGKDGFCIAFHADTGDLQLMKVKEMRRRLDEKNKRASLKQFPDETLSSIGTEKDSYLKDEASPGRANESIPQNQNLSIEDQGNNILPKNYVVVDTETTGLRNDDRLLEVAAVKVIDGKIAGQFSTLINPQRRINEHSIAFKINGISNEMVKDKPAASDIQADFEKFVGDSVVVGHNIGFDMFYISRDFPALSNNRTLDTMKLAKAVLPNEKNYKLETLVKSLGIDDHEEHRALSDCLQTQRLFESLSEIRNEKNKDVSLEKIWNNSYKAPLSQKQKSEENPETKKSRNNAFVEAWKKQAEPLANAIKKTLANEKPSTLKEFSDFMKNEGYKIVENKQDKKTFAVDEKTGKKIRLATVENIFPDFQAFRRPTRLKTFLEKTKRLGSSKKNARPERISTWTNGSRN